MSLNFYTWKNLNTWIQGIDILKQNKHTYVLINNIKLFLFILHKSLQRIKSSKHSSISYVWSSPSDLVGWKMTWRSSHICQELGLEHLTSTVSFWELQLQPYPGLDGQAMMWPYTNFHSSVVRFESMTSYTQVWPSGREYVKPCKVANVLEKYNVTCTSFLYNY